MRSARSGAKAGGFTIVELLVVILIITILAGILMPAIQGALRRSQEASTMNLIHQVQLAAQAYFNDYGDYPPGTWQELLGVGNVPPGAAGTNEGIEVLVACLTTQNQSGPYLRPESSQLANTDNDNDNGNVADTTNWYFNSTDLFELVDYWDNPLVYFHSRDYARRDGVIGEVTVGSEILPVYESPTDPPDPGIEQVSYTDADGELRYCYARSFYHVRTLNYPKLDSFQLYSWGADLWPGRAVTADEENLVYPGWTPGDGTPPNDRISADTGGPWAAPGGSTWRWIQSDGNLCNWEE